MYSPRGGHVVTLRRYALSAGVLLATVALAVASVSLLLHDADQATQARSAVEHLASYRENVLLMSTLQASMPVDPTVGGPAEIDRRWQDAEKALSSLPRAVEGVDLDEVRRRHARLLRVQERLLGLVRQARFVEGRALIETELGPQAIAARDAADSAARSLRARAVEQERQLQRGIVALTVTMASLMAAATWWVERSHLTLRYERARDEAALAGERRLAALVRNTRDVILLVDDDLVIRFANPSSGELCGADAATLPGRRLADLLPAMADRAAQADAVEPTNVKVAAADGTVRTFELLAIDLRRQPEVAGILLTGRDITEHKALERMLAHRATHDPLTGLATRDRFTSLVTDRLTTGGAVLMLDLDGFKAVNDTHGHAAGDQLLVLVAERLRASLREGDVCARLGGDEFAVFLADATNPEATAERLAGVLSTPFDLGDLVLTVGASVGVAPVTSELETVDALLRTADEAMYRAKRSHALR